MGKHVKNHSSNPHFFRIILPHNLQNESTLELPRKFVKKHGKCLYKYARLKLPTGAVSKMELKKDNKGAWLNKGWPDFVVKYSIQTGYFLVFKYKGGSRFSVQIYDLTTSEIDYPPLIPEKPIHAKEGIKKAPNLIEKANPCKPDDHFSFTIMMRHTYVKHSYVLHIPKCHSGRYLMDQNGKQAFLVIDGLEDDKTWAVKIFVGDTKKTGTKFRSGWKDFVKDNNLEEGDSCEFQLLRHMPNYYKVAISKVSK